MKVPANSPLHHGNYSTYGALILWGLVSFGTNPTVGSLVVHFAITPVFLIGFIALCHWEGRNQINPH